MKISKSLLLLTYSPDQLPNGEPIQISSNCLPIKALNYEPAGHSFHSIALQLSGISNPDSEDQEPETDSRSVSSDDRAPSSESYSTKGKKKTGEDGKVQQDHYALLGLSHLRFLATEDQIKKSYREMALKHHPDKQASLLLNELTEQAKEKKKEEIEGHFKAIQEAYEVLIDPVKRRIFDSTDEFDDEIPTDCGPKDFFRVFGPVFARNGRWSVYQPVPNLGDENMDLKSVDKFYDFWYGFKSWREFPSSDEYDLEEAESREHKRWMERQNLKLQEKARKLEYVRIRNLVDNAFKRDPRIIKRKENAKLEKLQKKEAKLQAKKLQEEEEKRKAEEEKKKKEEEDRKAAELALSQKKLKEREKRLKRKERTRLRGIVSPVLAGKQFPVSEDDVDDICAKFDSLQLKELCDKIEGKALDEISRALKQTLNKDGTEIQQNGNSSNSSAAAQITNSKGGIEKPVSEPKKEPVVLAAFEKKEKPWGKEEIEMLRKGMQKYPKGTSRRWEVISDYIGTNRSVDEILKATKTVLLQKPDSDKAFDSFLEKRKPAPVIASPLSTRVETAEDVKPGSSSSGIPSSGSGNNRELDSEAWSDVQERALIQALKAFPKDASQRWERVSASVPGKTVVQCKKKFAVMKESFRSKKGGE
ncbi:hypothetical protein LUZ60_010936 [Juncus effusus]|nr:hypothetical protein LUZ60_010936 [Juncus effusus]